MSAIKDVLEGKPIRSPIHPALVHLPIALLPLSLLLDIASWLVQSADQPLVRAAFTVLLGGIVTGLWAAVFGWVDYTTIRQDHRAKKTASRHMVLNVVAIALFAASVAMRVHHLEDPRTGILPMLVSLVGVGLLSYSGYLGGHLVYSEGVAVGRHRKKSRIPESTLQSPAGDRSMVPIIHEEELREGETLRVDVGGTIIVVARVSGTVFAVQEFCTHRYGPLSEGALTGNEIICPWHCSKFDLRTGKVTEGPAKVDLRTFRVEAKDGKIWLERPTSDSPKKD